MKINLKITWSSTITIAVGLITLLGYFLAPNISATPSTLGVLRDYFLQIAVILAAVGLIVGILNLLGVHWKKIRSQQKQAFSSLILFAAFLATFILGSADYFLGIAGNPERSWSFFLFKNIQIPVETSLLAILAIALAYASIRLLTRRLNLFSVLFLASFLLVLAGVGPEIPYISDFVRPWILQVPALAGTRGLLLGIGLGSIATGLRILTGAEHPYGG